MGYSSSGGIKGLGTFNNTPSTESDLEKTLELIGERGNFRVDTEANRDLLSGAKLYEGLLLYNTTANALQMYDGSGWLSVWSPPGAFTATFAGGLTVGAGGSATGTLEVVGGQACIKVVVTLGSSGFAVGDATMNFPTGASGASLTDLTPLGDVLLVDVSAGATGRYRGMAYKSATGVRILRDGGGANIVPLTSTAPFTWAAGDQMFLNLRYPIG